MSKETPAFVLDENLDEELRDVVVGELKTIRREKFDLSSTRVVLDRLLKDGVISPDDKLPDIMAAVEAEFKKIEDI